MLFQPTLISLVFLPQYVFVVMAVLVLEAGVGALARLYEEQVGPELKMNLNRTFLENYGARTRETAAIDQMQKEVSTVHREEFLSRVGPHTLSKPVCARVAVEQLRTK